MAQTAKFIDVTRTYIPVDPNSFPESLHAANAEAGPEQKVPVMAYKGYNFLPTSYGYKSYFGTASTVGIDALTAKVDAIFIMQNEFYENILIALTDSGVWIKKGEAAGSWTHSIVVVPDPTGASHYEWTYTVIADILYAYQQGQPHYHKFVGADEGQVTVTSVVPTFLNMAAQVGIFRAAGRLAFWDSADSISWANLDNFADFEPSLETLAGYATFTDVQGRIVTIQPHGAGFMIYATKSIVYQAQSSDASFQWKPYVVLSNSGIAYPRQVAVASPDTLHFAYTAEGMKKIENAKEETIVPEVTDFLQGYQFPVYLKMISGRYLFLELLDPDYVNGLVQLSTEEVPGASYVFPGSHVEFPDTISDGLGSDSICYVMGGINEGAFTQGQPNPSDKKPGTSMQPIWTAYLSNNGVMDASNIQWAASPCPMADANGTALAFNPVGGSKTTNSTMNSTGKRAVTGAEAYVDGRWTLERFIAVQSAIWQKEDAAMSAALAAYTSKASYTSRQYESGVNATAAEATSYCDMGTFITGWSPPKIGYSMCKFWMMRAATGQATLKLRRTTKTVSNFVPEQTANLIMGSWYSTSWANAGSEYGDAVAACKGQQVGTYQGQSEVGPNSIASMCYWSNGGTIVYRHHSPPEGFYVVVEGAGYSGYAKKNAYYDTTYTVGAANILEDLPDAGMLIEAAYCEITGWKYTDTNGVTKTIAASGSCTAPAIYPSAGAAGSVGGPMPSIDKDGTICGVPYTPITIDGITIDWPSTSVELPPSSFLMQKGSIAPVYPTMEGALVYDTQLKKWGKMKLRYKHLVDYSPINSTATGIVPSNTFGILAGALTTAGKISLFDAAPTDSYISYGKVGYYRLGKTSPEEVTVHFRSPSSGSIKIETSLHGKDLSSGFVVSQQFENANKATVTGGYPGNWANIEIRGIYDINYLEYRGFIQGRR